MSMFLKYMCNCETVNLGDAEFASPQSGKHFPSATVENEMDSDEPVGTERD